MRRKVDEPFVKEEDRRVKKGRRFSKINQKKKSIIAHLIVLLYLLI